MTFEYPPHIVGGAGTYAYKITKEMASLGHDVHVFTPEMTPYLVPPNVTMESVPSNNKRPLGALQFWLGLPDVIERAEGRNKFDIIHFNGTSYWFLNGLTETTKVVTIHHLAKDSLRHDRGVGVLLTLIEKRAMDRSTRIVAVSEYTKKRIVDGYGVDPDKIGVTYNGGSFDPSTPIDMPGAQKCLAVSKGKKTILFVGRVNDNRKGLDLLVKAMRLVLDRTDAMLIVAGKGDQSESRSLCSSLGIENNVAFIGYVEDSLLLGLYRSCDVYVCPSRLEGFGITVLDAQTYAKKVIATRIGPIPEIASPSTRLVEPNDIVDLASAILDSLDPFPSGASIPSKGDLDHLSSFSWERAVQGLIKEYEMAMK